MNIFQVGTGIVFITFVASCSSLNLTDHADSIPDLNNILNGGFNVQSMLGWMGQLNDKCQKNGVKMNLNVLLKAYSCLDETDNKDDADDDIKFTDTDRSTFGKVCKKLPTTLKCLKPFLRQLEQCLSSDIFKLEGVISEGLVSILKPFCSNDKAFTKAMEKDGPATVMCMAKHTDVLIGDIVECFEARSKTASPHDGLDGLCNDFETYKDCFIDSLEICQNPGVEKLVYRLLEQQDFQKVIYKYILRCK